jgi:hypothetical protein
MNDKATDNGCLQADVVRSQTFLAERSAAAADDARKALMKLGNMIDTDGSV